jgi:hypothetical protein
MPIPLSLPTPGSTPGPGWATSLNAAITAMNAASTGDVQLEAGRAGGATTVGASGFSTFPLDSVVTNIGGGSYNTSTFIYTVPKAGLYLCLGWIRLADSSTSRNVGISIGTSNADGPAVAWGTMGGTGANMRQSLQYDRLTRFSVNDQVRLFIYSDGATFSVPGSTGCGMSLVKLSD